MTWFRIDENSAFHWKVVEAGNAAWGAFCRAGAWASERLTDGKILWSVALTIAPRHVWDRLLKVGLCEDADTDGFYIHDFLDRNPTREDVLAIRASRIEAGRLGGKQKASKRLASALANGVAKTYPDPDPDPDQKKNTPLPPKGGRSRGTRLPAGWEPPAEAIAGVLAEFGIAPDEVRAELAQFRDYWAGVAGQRGAKLDWPATFRNRLRDRAQSKKIGGHFPAKPEPTEEPRDEAPAPWLRTPERPADDGPGTTIPLALGGRRGS